MLSRATCQETGLCLLRTAKTEVHFRNLRNSNTTTSSNRRWRLTKIGLEVAYMTLLYWPESSCLTKCQEDKNTCLAMCQEAPVNQYYSPEQVSCVFSNPLMHMLLYT
ncbi:uncharacterized protein LOC144293440 [Canis aureus]